MSNLEHNSIFEKIEFVKILREKNSPFLHNIQVVFEKAENLLATRFPVIFSNYTLHDIKHSIRVADYMYSIIKYKIEDISELDIVILLYSAILHDIGMAVDTEDLDQIKSENYADNKGCKLPIQLSGIKRIDWIKGIEDSDSQEYIAIQEYVRRFHGFRSRMFVERLHTENSTIFSIPSLPSTSIYEEIGLVCESHNESYDWIKDKLKKEQTKGKYVYSPQFCACILRLADIIDIDERRTPPELFDSINPQYRSKDEWLQHRVIQNIEKIEYNNGRLTFRFEGECSDPKTHRKIYHYLDWVKKELSESKVLLKVLSNKYFIDIDTEIARNIEPKGNYTIPDNKMSIDFKAVSSLLMGERIYGDKKYGLRELLQNSIDACRLRIEMEDNISDKWEEPYNPKIFIIFDEDSNKVILKDNGVGMTMDIIKNNFLSIGKSYYQSDNFISQGYSYKPIGNFGIGFLACFMLSDEVQIKTKHINTPQLYTINLEKGEEYSSIEYSGNNRIEGTEIVLKYEQFMECFEHIEEVEEFVKEQIKTEDIHIYICEKPNTRTPKLIDTKFHINAEDAFIIDVTKYLSHMEGFIALNNTKIVYEKIGDLKIDAPIFSYKDAKIIDSRNINDNLILSQITRNDILEYLIVSVDDTLDHESYSYYFFFDNNTEDLAEVKVVAKSLVKDMAHRRGIDNPSVETDIWQMYLYNDSGKYHYSIPYFSEHTESQNMNTTDDYKYNPLGDFDYGMFDLNSIYNNSILVKNEDYSLGFPNDHYMRYTSLNVLEYVLNIKDNLELDVSRHSFNKQDEIEEVHCAIMKAIHIAAYKELKLNIEEKDVLKSFILKHYPEESKYIKTFE